MIWRLKMIKSNAFKKLTARFVGTIGALVVARFLNMYINPSFVFMILLILVLIYRKEHLREIQQKKE